MNNGFSKDIRERILKSLMDWVILKELGKNSRMSGYDIILLFQRTHKMLLSAGSVYSALYALERKGLVEGNTTSEKRVYKLSKKGQAKIEKVLSNRQSIRLYIESLI